MDSKSEMTDIIVLGIATQDTHGPGSSGEETGILVLPGISKE